MSKPPKKTHRLCVEQAIAFGRSPDWMRDHLGASDMEIDAAMRWIDQCNEEDEHGLRPVPCGTVKGYNRHVHRHQPPCTPCKRAYNRACRERRGRKRARLAALEELDAA